MAHWCGSSQRALFSNDQSTVGKASLEVYKVTRDDGSKGKDTARRTRLASANDPCHPHTVPRAH